MQHNLFESKFSTPRNYKVIEVWAINCTLKKPVAEFLFDCNFGYVFHQTIVNGEIKKI